MRVVLDTNTLVSAIGWTGPPAEILDALVAGRHSLITSRELLEELTRVLTYPKLRCLAGDPRLPRVLAWLHHPEHIVMPKERITAIQADPPDNLVLEAAVAGRAEGIISGDRHLLRLKSFRDIPILTARRFATQHL